MATINYSGLYEDETAEVLRSAGPCSVIRSGPFSWEPARVLYEDGMLSSGAGYLIEYIDGRRSGIVSAGYLVRRLSHCDFSVTVPDPEDPRMELHRLRRDYLNKVCAPAPFIPHSHY